MSRRPGLLSQAWFKWKSLRLPWRKTWLVGSDLSGNTFWEFKDALNSNRFRRIVRYPGGTHYSEVKISPQWHQWLRHTRDAAPSIPEQQYEVSRQARMKQLAAEADERWKSIPSFLDAPDKQQPQPAIGVQDPGGYAALQTVGGAEEHGVRTAVETPTVDSPTTEKPAAIEGGAEDQERTKGKTKDRKAKKENPWEKMRPKGAPGENWQPEGWTPGVAQRR